MHSSSSTWPQSPPLLTAKEEITRVNKRIRAGEKEAEEIKKRVVDQKKTLERLERDLASVQEGEWAWIGGVMSLT